MCYSGYSQCFIWGTTTVDPDYPDETTETVKAEAVSVMPLVTAVSFLTEIYFSQQYQEGLERG